METVKAPPGFEGCCYFNDGSRSYDVAVRRVGETWWKVCFLGAGHVHLTAEERRARAEGAIVDMIEARGFGQRA